MGRLLHGAAALAAVTALAVLSAPGTSPAGARGGGAPAAPSRTTQAEPGAPGAVTLRVGVDATGRGTFMAQGAVSDAGIARVRRAMSRGRLTLVQALAGESGTLVVRVVQRCGSTSSAWRVVRGTDAYAGLSGGGNGTAASCASPARPLRATYRGAVSLPEAPVHAAPGPYGGWTGQGERVTFEVLPGGRLVSNLRVERLFARCGSSPDVVLEPAFPSTYALSAEGAFTAFAGGVHVSARLEQGAAAGTIAYEPDPRLGTCSSGAVAWTARTPPDPLPRALPGAYCGSTTQGLGDCLTLTPDGRVTRLRLELTVECVQPEQATFDAVVTFGGLVPTRSNLRFEVNGGIDEGASGDFVLRGAFDTTGAVAGTVTLHRVTVDVEGTVFTCRNAVHGWAARRLG